MELSAAVDGQHGLFVTVSSKETPIASVVRTVTMDGLTPKGSDFALPLPTASNASVAPSITAGVRSPLICSAKGRHQHRAVMDYRQRLGSRQRCHRHC